MKKFMLLVTICASFLSHADSIFDSKDLPGAAKGTAMCHGTQLSPAGVRAVSQALDAFLENTAARAYLAPSAPEVQKFSWLKNLITTDADDNFTWPYLGPRVEKVEGKKQFSLYPPRMAAILRESVTYPQFKYLYTATFAAYNCDHLHYRGLGEALHDQFSN